MMDEPVDPTACLSCWVKAFEKERFVILAKKVEKTSTAGLLSRLVREYLYRMEKPIK